MKQIGQVFDQINARYGCKAGLDLIVGAGSVHKEHIEPDQAQKRHQDQHHIGDKPSEPYGRLSSLFIILSHFISFSAVALKTIMLRMPVMISRITDRAPAMP